MSECKKLMGHANEWDAIYPFLEWLQEHGVVLSRYYKDEEGGPYEHLQPISKNIQGLLYEYFGVDPEKLEKERRKILEKMRERFKRG